MPGKRTNQFNLMLTDHELAMLKEKAAKSGFVNKSQYIRELIRDDKGQTQGMADENATTLIRMQRKLNWIAWTVGISAAMLVGVLLSMLSQK